MSVARNAEGYPVCSFFGYDVIGYCQSDEDVDKSPTQQAAAPGRFKYRDVSGNNEVNTEDRTHIGNPNPDFTYGLNLNGTYKRFDLSVIFYGSQGNDVFNSLRFQLGKWGDFPAALSNEFIFDSWSPENPNAKAPMPENASNFSNGGTNSFYVEDGSFFKCRSAMLGYSLDRSIFGNVPIERIRLYFQVTNLFTITKYSGLDPELSSAFGSLGSSQQSAAFGIDNSNYPNNFKNFILGLNISF